MRLEITEDKRKKDELFDRKEGTIGYSFSTLFLVVRDFEFTHF